jgi:hypothetical protein
VLAARVGKALNKRGQRYKPRAIDDIEEVIRVHVEPALGTRRITGIRRGDVQAIVDELSPRLSGSRVRSVSDLRVLLTPRALWRIPLVWRRRAADPARNEASVVRGRAAAMWSVADDEAEDARVDRRSLAVGVIGLQTLGAVA